MDNYIVINGKKAELTEEQLEKLGIKVDKENPFARRPYEEKYYYITDNGNINFYSENDTSYDTRLFDNVNYFNDEDFAKQVAWHELLNRKLLKYAYEHDAADCDWKDKNTKKFYIVWNVDENEWIVDWSYVLKKGNNTIYFNNEEIAEKAVIDVVIPFMKEHPDFVW